VHRGAAIQDRTRAGWFEPDSIAQLWMDSGAESPFALFRSGQSVEFVGMHRRRVPESEAVAVR
jgi:hypothetical protein